MRRPDFLRFRYAFDALEILYCKSLCYGNHIREMTHLRELAIDIQSMSMIENLLKDFPESIKYLKLFPRKFDYHFDFSGFSNIETLVLVDRDQRYMYEYFEIEKNTYIKVNENLIYLHVDSIRRYKRLIISRANKLDTLRCRNCIINYRTPADMLGECSFYFNHLIKKIYKGYLIITEGSYPEGSKIIIMSCQGNREKLPDIIARISERIPHVRIETNSDVCGP